MTDKIEKNNEKTGERAADAGYSALAPLYDAVNGESFDYDGYADFADRIFGEHGIEKGSLVLDLACGSGALTLRLLEKGYDVIGVDLSTDMLDICREKCADSGYSPLLLCQDLCSLDLYGTVEGAVCTLDSLNYLTEKGELDTFFGRLKNFISPNGIFIFDINTERKFSEIYASNSYTYDENGVFCVWQNSYNEKTRLCDFDLTFFEKQKNGLYRRREEHQRERCHTDGEIAAAALGGGFDIIGRFRDFVGSRSDGSEYRRFYILKRKEYSI